MAFLSGMAETALFSKARSVNCRDQCMHMKVLLQSVSARMYGFHMHVGRVELQQGLAEC